jgi:hypothetical protein
MEESKRQKFRLKDIVARQARIFMLGLEANGLKLDTVQDFEDPANILRPVYAAAGLQAHAPKPSLPRERAPNAFLPADPLPTAESLKTLRGRKRLPY